MKKNDIILIGIIAIVGMIGLLYISLSKTAGDKVVVTVDGEVYKELPLNKDATFTIEGVNGGTNILQIKDGIADIIEANCPDKLCVNQHEIENNGESQICLPNKVVVEVQSEKESDVDIIVR